MSFFFILAFLFLDLFGPILLLGGGLNKSSRLNVREVALSGRCGLVRLSREDFLIPSRPNNVRGMLLVPDGVVMGTAPVPECGSRTDGGRIIPETSVKKI